MNKEQREQLKALAQAATPGPWHVQYGDDHAHMCMTAVSASNSRTGNDGKFSDDDPLIAVTYHQCYPYVMDEVEEDGSANSAFIAAANPQAVLALLEQFDTADHLLRQVVAEADAWAKEAGVEISTQGELLAKIRAYVDGKPAARPQPLAELPPPVLTVEIFRRGRAERHQPNQNYYTADQIREYSQASAAAEREQCARLAVQWGDGRMPDAGGNALRNYATALREGRQPVSHDADAAKRLRLICKMVGIESHVPADDETLWGAAFTVLGQIRAALEAARQPQDERASLIWEAISHNGNKWPDQLSSGVMFFRGERITRDEFEARAALARKGGA